MPVKQNQAWSGGPTSERLMDSWGTNQGKTLRKNEVARGGLVREGVGTVEGEKKV